jgi:DNA (cytosine-5)-methyltransferase 1
MDRLDGYLRVREAAKFLGVAPNTLRNWGREEKIAEFRHPVNNYRLYRRSDLERLLRRVTQSGRGRRVRKPRQVT